MPFTLTMPEVGETVTEGTIERWLKKPGEQITKYEPIVEINTDKVEVELPSPVSGTVVDILAPEGTVVSVGGPLATIETIAGETPAEVAPPMPREEQPAAASTVAEKEDAPVAGATAPGPVRGDGAAAERSRATPRVRKLAEELGIELAQLAGSGPGGRIVEEDVRAASTGTEPAVAAPTMAEPKRAPVPTTAGADEESVALTSIRRTIAQRMSASAFSAPHAWLAVEADVTGLVALRGLLKEEFRERQGIDLTYLPFMAHAVAQALPEHTYLNASWAEDRIILK